MKQFFTWDLGGEKLLGNARTLDFGWRIARRLANNFNPFVLQPSCAPRLSNISTHNELKLKGVIHTITAQEYFPRVWPSPLNSTLNGELITFSYDYIILITFGFAYFRWLFWSDWRPVLIFKFWTTFLFNTYCLVLAAIMTIWMLSQRLDFSPFKYWIYPVSWLATDKTGNFSN